MSEVKVDTLATGADGTTNSNGAEGASGIVIVTEYK